MNTNLNAATTNVQTEQPKRNRRRLAVIALIALAVLAVPTTAAMAYVLLTGSGSTVVKSNGSGNSGADMGANVVMTIAPVANLTPGGTPQNVSVTFKNNNVGSVSIGTLTLTIAPADLPVGCVASDFSLVNPTGAVGVINAGATSAAKVGTIKMNDDPARDQTTCLNNTNSTGVKVTVSY